MGASKDTNARILILAAGCALLVAGCGSAKSDWENICNAEQRSGAASIKDPAEKAHAIAGWLKAHVKTARVQRELGALGGVEAGPEKNAIILAAAKEAGVQDCPMATQRP